MPNNISSVQCKLIGISCLEGGERRRVMDEWNERFYEHDTLWVDAKPGQNALSLVKDITEMASSRDIEILGGQTVMLTVFLDLTQAPDEALLKEIVGVPKELAHILGCVVPLTLEFGYLGQYAFGDRAALKANVQKVVDVNRLDDSRRKQLCMVGLSPAWKKDEDISWKSVMVCLDLLRRSGSPASMVPVDGHDACGNVGFLRYGEYDEEKLNGLLAEKEQIDHALSDDGNLAFLSELNEALRKIERDVEAHYPVDGSCHPIHPKMYPDGFIETMKAKKGGEPFASGRNHTLHALNMTAKRMKEQIQDSYQIQIQNAAQYLVQYIKKANMGIELESNRKYMEDVLTPQPIGMPEPMIPSLAYKDSGYASEIDTYLKDVRRHAGAKCRHEFAKALLEAYRQIPDSEYAQRAEALRKEETTVKNKLSRLMTKQQLIGKITAGDALPKTAFNITLATGCSAYWALTRDENIGLELDRATAGLMTTAYYIDATYGGLKQRDNAPLKALQLLQFSCSQAILDNLIG